MFRLIKLAVYAMIGYVLYELYQGMTQQQGGYASSGGGGGRSRSSFGEQGRGRGGTLTGAGQGMMETAADASGGEMRHTVGRGVVS
jgi:hypothetical protein